MVAGIRPDKHPVYRRRHAGSQGHLHGARGVWFETRGEQRKHCGQHTTGNHRRSETGRSNRSGTRRHIAQPASNTRRRRDGYWTGKSFRDVEHSVGKSERPCRRDRDFCSTASTANDRHLLQRRGVPAPAHGQQPAQPGIQRCRRTSGHDQPGSGCQYRTCPCPTAAQTRPGQRNRSARSHRQRRRPARPARCAGAQMVESQRPLQHEHQAR